MTSAAVLSVVVRANTTQANTALAATEGQLKKLGATSAATTGTMAARTSALGATLTKAVTVPVAAVGTAAIAMSMDFNKAMRLIQTQAGASAQEVAHMKQEILDFAASGQTTATPKELATALYRVESAGFRGAKAMAVLRASTELSEIAQSDLEGTTNAVVAAQKTQIKGTGNLHKTIGTLNAIVGAGNLRMDDLTSAMGTGFLTNAKQMGLTLKQAGAALATLTVQGQPAAASATRLSMAWRMMMAPTDQAKDALHSIGLEAETLGKMMQAHQFPQAIALLSDKLDALGTSPAALQQKASVIRDIFGARSAVGISAILNGLDDYNQRLDQIGRTGDMVDDSLEAIRATPGFQLNASLSQLSASLIHLGDVLAPVIIPALVQLVDLLATIAGGFAGLPKPIRTTGLVLIGMAAAAGPILKLVGVVLKLQLALRGLAVAEALAGGAGLAGAAGGAAAGGAAGGAAVGAAEVGAGAGGAGLATRIFGGAGAGGGRLGMLARGVGGKVLLPVGVVLTGVSAVQGFNRALKISKDADSASLDVRLKARIDQESQEGPFKLSGLGPVSDALSSGLNAIPASLGIGTGSERAKNDLKLIQGYLAQIQEHHMRINNAQQQSIINASLYLEEQGKITHQQQDQVQAIARQATSLKALRETGLNAGVGMGRDFGLNIAAGLQNTNGNIRAAAKMASDTAIDELKSLPKGARKAGAESMVSMAAQLAAQGKIPQSVVRQLVRSINAQWPGMVDPAIANSKKLARGVTGAFQQLAGAIAHPLGSISDLVNSFLGSLDLPKINFSGIASTAGSIVDKITGLLPGGGGKGGKKKATGGFLVPGSGSGDSYPVQAMLEPGEIFAVLNRNAAAAVMAANAAAPRHALATGGVLDRAGSKALDTMGDGALKYLKAVQKKAMTPAGGAAGAGRHRSYPMLSGDTDFSIALGNALSRMARATHNPISVTSGWRSRAEQAALYASKGPGLAAPPGSSNHERGTAADISPGRETFGGVAGRYGLGFPLSFESWHIELGGARRAMNGAVLNRMKDGGVRFPQYLKHGDHWLHPHNPVNANEGHTLLWQAGLSDRDAGRLTTVLPDESSGNWFADNPTSDALGVWQILGRASGSPAGPLTNPIINSINAAIKWRTEGPGAWPTYPGSGPEGHILRDQVFAAKHGKVKPGRGIKPADDNKLKIGSLPISSAAQGELRHALKLARSIGIEADSYEDFGQRASSLEADVGGHPATWWFTEELKRLIALRNAIISAHLILSNAIIKMNKMIAKMKKGGARSKLKELRDSASGKVQDIDSSLGDLQGAPNGVGKYDLLSRAPTPGVLGGRIFDVQMSLKQLGVDSTGVGTDDLTQQKLDAALKNIQTLQVNAAVAPILSQIPQMITETAGGAFVGAFAKGGSPLRSGLALVGEEGPELISTGPGARIKPMSSGGAAAVTPEYEIHVHGHIIPFEDHVGDVVEVKQRDDASSSRRSFN